MKKIVLSLVILSISLGLKAQDNPCPTIGQVAKFQEVINGNGTCTAKIRFFLANDVSNSNPKGVRVEVFCGPVTGPAVLDQCFIAPTPGTFLITNTFTCPCGSPVNIRITRFTASNGQCQGGTCGTVFNIQESPLPVNFKLFTAARNRSIVGLKWETASEQNNSGFSVERNTKGNWEQVAFVPSQAAGGNSDALLTYSLSDLNSEKGISQYRIKQIDIDAKSKYSEVRAVRGEGQAGKTTVYPNPSSNGRVNVVFEDATVTRDISVLDMSGRIVKQFRGVTNNNIQIENLNPGMYSIKISVPATGEQTMEKIIVNKR